MSTLLTGLVWELPANLKMTLGAHHVLLCLADRANPDTGECWPGIKDISKRCRMTERSAQRHLRSLEKARLLTIETRRRYNGSLSSNLYVLHLPELSPPGDNLSPPPRQDVTTPGDNLSPPEPWNSEPPMELRNERGGSSGGTVPRQKNDGDLPPASPPPLARRAGEASASPPAAAGEESDPPAPAPRCPAAGPSASSAQAGTPKPDRIPDRSKLKPFVDGFIAAYQAEWPDPYVIQDNDLQYLASFVRDNSTITPAEFVECAISCWHSGKQFVASKALTIYGLCGKWSEFRAELALCGRPGVTPAMKKAQEKFADAQMRIEKRIRKHSGQAEAERQGGAPGVYEMWLGKANDAKLQLQELNAKGWKEFL